MFDGCSLLENIIGLNNIFGTYNSVYNKTEGQYNPQVFSQLGVKELFKNCSSLKLGQNSNSLAPWARMAVNISSVNSMF